MRSPTERRACPLAKAEGLQELLFGVTECRVNGVNGRDRQGHPGLPITDDANYSENGDSSITYELRRLLSVGRNWEALVDEFDDVLGGGAGEEDFGDARFFHGGDVGFGNDAADQDDYVVHAFGFEEGH